MSESIREAVHAAVTMNLAAANPMSTAAGDLYDRVLRQVEIPLLDATLRHYGGNQSLAAAHLGLNRATLRSMLRRHRINPRSYYR